MKIVLVTDAWEPQVNGVVTTIKNLIKHLSIEHEVVIIEPSQFKTFPFPLYPEIQLAINPRKAHQIIEAFKPDAIHIFTEGTLGISVRNYCVKQKLSFTTSAHTKFPEYLCKRMPFIPIAIPRGLMRWFHSAATGTLVNTKSHRDEMITQGFKNLTLWARGVDREIFKNITTSQRHNESNKKNLLFVGRVAKAKNIQAFCELSKNMDYQCWVVGDGPKLKKLKKRWGKTINFVGYQKGEALARYYQMADVCVFPSLTDTFGVTMIESMACGTPVAAFPVTGPIDVITEGVDGAMSPVLPEAVASALKIDRNKVLNSSQKFTWQRCTEIFLNHLAPINT